MKKYTIFIATMAYFIMLSGCTPKAPIYEGHDLNTEFHRGMLLGPLRGKSMTLLHITADSSLAPRKYISAGERLGRVDPWPAVLSVSNDALLKQALNQYGKGDYKGAAQILDPIFPSEKENPFFLITYAKTLFWIDQRREDSFRIFQMLDSQIEQQNKKPDIDVIIDLWFPDLYWKLGCLYLDKKDYNKAVYEISRALVFGQGSDDLYEQALSYLTEAYYFLQNEEMNHYFYNRTLTQFPNNMYVKRYYLK